MHTMLTVDTVEELAAHAGTSLGQSRWVTIEAAMVAAFAALSGDDHWIHVDRERAAREMPDGRTIAHGLLVLSLIPGLQRDIYSVRRRGIGLNYGYDRVRFLAQVAVGARVRLDLVLEAVEAHAQGARVVTTATMEIEGGSRPALVARNILLLKAPDHA